MNKAILACTAVLAAAVWLGAQDKPKDETMDWLMGQATTAPSTRPADPTTHPVIRENPNPESRYGFLTLSNGERIPGRYATTREKPLRVWDAAAKDYHDVPFTLVKKMEVKIAWEREEREWHFRESGSDIKEYSGKTYPAREMEYVVTLVNGQTVTGGIVAPIYLKAGERTEIFVLNKRQKGEIGQTLKDLVYVKKLELEEEKEP